MRIREVPAEQAERELAAALGAVEAVNPGMTAAVRSSRGQRLGAVAVGLVLLAALVLVPVTTAVVLTTAGTLLYLATVVHRVALVRVSLSRDPSIHVSDDDARAVPDDRLPVYTVLVPAYGEPTVVAGLVAALERLEYPRDRLDIKLLLEVDDLETIGAAHAVVTDLDVDVLLVPPGEPRTKPRALNYGMRFARGSMVTIFDAEDHPEPLQLRRAVVAFDRSSPATACLQARLSFYGGDRNLLTRWFTAEYATWFSLYLPGLVVQGAPIPLGGTSNHFRVPALAAVGGWDAHNVTEDCDLGIRLQRAGYEIGLLDSTTMEEPNSDVVNWVKQRSRWYKGYLQTFLVASAPPACTAGGPGVARGGAVRPVRGLHAAAGGDEPLVLGPRPGVGDDAGLGRAGHVPRRRVLPGRAGVDRGQPVGGVPVGRHRADHAPARVPALRPAVAPVLGAHVDRGVAGVPAAAHRPVALGEDHARPGRSRPRRRLPRTRRGRCGADRLRVMATPDPIDEGRHTPDDEPLWNESYYLDWFADDLSVGGYARIGFYPNLGRVWYWACLVGPDRPLVTVIDHEVALPRSATSLEVRHDGLWADHTVETPQRAHVHQPGGLRAASWTTPPTSTATPAENGSRSGSSWTSRPTAPPTCGRR